MSPIRNRRKRKRKRNEGWSVEIVAHLVWSALHELLESYADEQQRCLRAGANEFARKEKHLIKQAIETEQAVRTPNIEKTVEALVPAAKSFCQRLSPELRFRKHPRALYTMR